MLPRTFKGPWGRVRKELQEHDAELEGHEVTLTINEAQDALQHPASEGKPVSLYDRMKGHIGRFDFGNANLSQNTSEKFIEILEEKRRQGHL